jgi:hypothetical protein
MDKKDMQEFIRLRDDARQKVIRAFQLFPGGMASAPEDSVAADHQAALKDADKAWTTFIGKARGMGLKV